MTEGADPSDFNIKIYIDTNGDITITSLFREFLPLVKELSGDPKGEKDEHCPGNRFAH